MGRRRPVWAISIGRAAATYPTAHVWAIDNADTYPPAHTYTRIGTMDRMKMAWGGHRGTRETRTPRTRRCERRCASWIARGAPADTTMRHAKKEEFFKRARKKYTKHTLDSLLTLPLSPVNHQRVKIFFLYLLKLQNKQ